MLLKFDDDACDGTRIAESDPLPPEDRVSIRKADWLERLYRAHRDRLVRFALRHAQSDQAADIVQQLFVRLAARGKGNPLKVDAPNAYLRQATINLIRNDARSQARRSINQHVSCDDIELADVDPVAGYEARDMLERLEAVVAELEPRTREIFLAHRIDGLSYAQIAARTNLSIKTVEKHMSRAIGHVIRRFEA
ncbi:sigma-70 family RNA polymerase sigma factor [Novosphingobium sp. BL-8H]|uniref:RNA polymerase sigma factor n=1 Tax=Novosphingobium sp. BL-8H TaxID=3127640 RepID=UPI003756447C